MLCCLFYMRVFPLQSILPRTYPHLSTKTWISYPISNPIRLPTTVRTLRGHCMKFWRWNWSLQRWDIGDAWNTRHTPKKTAGGKQSQSKENICVPQAAELEGGAILSLLETCRQTSDMELQNLVLPCWILNMVIPCHASIPPFWNMNIFSVSLHVGSM